MLLEIGFGIRTPMDVESFIERVEIEIDDSAVVEFGPDRYGSVWLAVDVPNSGSHIDLALSLVASLRSLGAEVLDVEDDFVNTTEVGDRFGVSREAARKWTQRKPGGVAPFPRPASVLPGGVQIWPWREVHRWVLANQQRHGDPQMCFLNSREHALLRLTILNDNEMPVAEGELTPELHIA
ncbi:MAG: hypothetical protein WA969_09655 [Candidatus Microthrix parvicella]